MELLVTGRGRKRSLLRRCAMKGTSPVGEGDVGASVGTAYLLGAHPFHSPKWRNFS